MKRTVAILGAGGIGRHHANWWRLEGAEIVAILGRNEASVRASADKLKAMFGFDGAVYTELATLLREVRPDVVDVCTPAACHFDQAKLALQTGCQVLCEKPLAFDGALPHATLIAQAEELAALARAGGRTFGLCSQFSVAARTCLELLHGPTQTPLRAIHMALRSPVRGRQPNPAQTWIDLGPHLVAALQTLVPGTDPDWSTLRVTAAGHDADFTFTLPAPGGDIAVRLAVGFTTGEPANVRRITLDATAFDLLGEAGPDGIFRMRYRADSGIDEPRPDPMRLLIRAFMHGTPILNADAACRNQAILLHILARITHGT